MPYLLPQPCECKLFFNECLFFHSPCFYHQSWFLVISLDRRQAAPRFVIKPQSAFAYEGQSAKFYCRVIAIAAPTLTWYHNNVELRQSVKFMKRYNSDDYTFIINRVKLEDRGEYIIRAENHYGFREEVVFLNVQRKYSQADSRGDDRIFNLEGKVVLGSTYWRGMIYLYTLTYFYLGLLDTVGEIQSF